MQYPRLDTDNIEVLRTQFIAWMQGATARASGITKLHENPHPSRTHAGDAWENGWEQIDFQLGDKDD